MKKAKIVKILAVLFSLVLTLGTAIGIYAVAIADNGSAEIISKNVELEAELSLVFAVDSRSVRDGDTVYLLIWDREEDGGEYTLETATQKKTSFLTANYAINGVTNSLLFKTGRIAVDDFQKLFYVRTCIVRGDTEIYGELITYSIEEYALQRLSENRVTPDQAELYYNVLRYALAADKLLNDGAQIEDKYVIFAAEGMTFGNSGATLATKWFNKDTGMWQMPFSDCRVSDAEGNSVDVSDDLAPGIYTVSPCLHTYASDWTSDSDGHWHAATCTHTGLRSDYAEHTEMNAYGKCDICNYNIQADIDAGFIASSDAAFATRWDEAERVMGAEATAALKELYDFYGTDWFDWLLSLYDVESGCFYYANSARDYEGFLTDAESTCQTLDMFFHSGAFDALGKVWAKTIPADMKAKCLAYIQNLQDPDDGYFYHPQWGKSIGSSRRGRDLSQCITLISRMGGTPLYKTATERLEENNATPTATIISAFMETNVHKSSVIAVVDDRFQSEEKMKAYLDNLVAQNTDAKGYFNSYTFGHILSSETAQIKAAGLGSFVCNYIDALQNPETGFYEELDPTDSKAGYQAASGIIKISAFYSSVNGAIKYGDKLVDSLVNIILSTEKTNQITYVFNPIGALSAAVSSVKKHGTQNELSAVRQNIYAKLPDIVDRTIEKLSGYKHEDGSFSYLESGRSLVSSQGVIASLGYDEGDVNGLACAMHYILGSLFDCLGITRVPMLKYTDYITFRDYVNSAEPIVKSEVPNEPVDFEGYEGSDMPFGVSGPSQSSLSDGEKFEIVEMAGADGVVNNALRIDSVSNKNIWFTVDAKSPYQSIASFSFSFDLYVDSAVSSQLYQIFLRNSSTGHSAYMFELVAEGGKVYLRDACTDAYTDTKYKTVLGIEENLDTWMNIKLEYYVIRDTDTGKITAKTKVYKNGSCVTISDNYFVNNASANSGFFAGTAERPNAMTSIDEVYFLALRSPASSIRLDNIKCEPKDVAEFSNTGVDPYAGGIFGKDAVRNETVTFEEGTNYSNVTYTSGFGSLETVTKGSNSSNTALKLVSAAGKQETMNITLPKTLDTTSCFVFEADVRLDSADTDYTHQIIFKNGSKGVFMLALGLSGNTVKVKTDLSTSSSRPTDLGVNATKGEWFTLKIEYYPVDDTTAYIKAYKNGVLTGESTQYYDKGTADVQYTVTSMQMYTRVGPASTLYLDDIRFTFEPSKTYN